MRLLFVIPSITNYFTFLEQLAKELSERGHEVHLATSRRHIARIESYRRPVFGTIHHIDFPRALSPLKHIRAARDLRKLVDRTKPDIVNIHFSAALFTTMIGKDSSWPPTTGTIHGLGSPLITGWRKFLVSLAEKWSAERVDKVYVLTTDDKEYLKKHAKKADVNVPNSFGIGCELDRFDPRNVSEDTRRLTKAKLDIREDDFVYVLIGRQTHFKGFDKVVEAFVEVRKTLPRSKLILLGEKDLIHPSSLNPKFNPDLTSEGGILRVGWQEQVQDYLAIADLNIFPSEREGLPVNLMESLAMGVPVITVNSRGCKEVVRSGIDGVVLEKNTTEHLAAEMIRLQKDREALKRLSENAFRDRNRFDRTHFIEDQFRIYEELTGKNI